MFLTRVAQVFVTWLQQLVVIRWNDNR